MRQVPIEIALVLQPNVQLAGVYGLTDLFRFADELTRNRLGSTAPLLRTTHFALNETGTLERTYDTAPGTDSTPTVIIVPPCHSPPDRDDHTTALAQWLRTHGDAGVTLASVCGGTFLLAETGLLDGRRATTHWVFAHELAARFPAIIVDTNPLVIDDGEILTAGGMTAWADLGLTLVDRLLGSVAMIETSRFMMIDPPGREQRLYSPFQPNLSHGDEAVLKVQNRLEADAAMALAVTGMAEVAGLQERTFVRRFLKATGLNPNDYQQHLRVEKARALLEATVQPIDTIAWAVGYSDPASFRRVFTRIAGLSPGEYRKRFARARRSPRPARSGIGVGAQADRSGPAVASSER